MLFHVVSVDFGNDQRHMGIHSERRRFIDRNGTSLARDGNKLSRNVAARAEESDVDLLKRSRVEFLYRDRFTAELDGFAHGTRRTNRAQTCDREASAFQYTQ